MSHALHDRGDAGRPKVGFDQMLLFWACFIALIATAFGFVVRTQIMGDWQAQFGLTETQKGELFGVGLWPFAVSIVLFSLIIDSIGYGTAMAFAFLCHVSSALITIFAGAISEATGISPYWVLYVGTFIVALGNGTVEAVVNPVVATMFAGEKTKWLNILHAGWPGGLVLGGVLSILMGSAPWQYKVALLFLPVIGYGILMLGRKFPINERVAAGVSYMEMLKQVGFLGALLAGYMIVSEVGRVFGLPIEAQWVITGVIALGFGLFTRSLGQPLFVFLLLIMVPLATTELGTDSWITDLMTSQMGRLTASLPAGLVGTLQLTNAGWILVYTSLIMMVLRFFAGPIVHKLSPLGLLCASAAIAAGGLLFLSKAEGLMILVAATLYGLGKTFFWPTMLGLAAEQSPRGGALTLNTLGGVGMLAVGVLGAPFLGKLQDNRVQERLNAEQPGLYQQVIGPEQRSVFGAYNAIEPAKLAEQPAAIQREVAAAQEGVKKETLATVAIFPCVMFACYLALLIYFQAKGGYRPQTITKDPDSELQGVATGAVAAEL